MKRTLLLTVTVILASSLLGGCISRAIKEGASVATGAKGVFADVQAPGSLAAYTRFELGRFQDGMNGRIPKELWTHLPERFEEHMASSGLPNKAGKVAVVRGIVYHYEGEGLGGLIFGDFEEVITRAELVDKATGKVIGTANCIGRTTTTARKGVRNKADGLAKAIIRWLKEHYPKE